MDIPKKYLVSDASLVFELEKKQLTQIEQRLLYGIVKHVKRPETWTKIVLDQYFLLGHDDYSEFRVSHDDFASALTNLHMSYRISLRQRIERIAGDSPFMDLIKPGWFINEVRVPTTYFVPIWVKGGRKRKQVTASLREWIHEKYNNTCVYCGSRSEHVDHVIPVSRGGTNDEENLVASCRSCNIRKRNYLLSELGWSMNHV